MGCDCPEEDPGPTWQMIGTAPCEEVSPDWYEAVVDKPDINVGAVGVRAYVNEPVDGEGIVTKPIGFNYDGASFLFVCGPVTPFATSVVQVWGFVE